MTKEQKLLSLVAKFRELGVDKQIDYDKFYLYSLITHSTAIEGSKLTETENRLLFDHGIKPSVDVGINVGINEQKVIDLIEINNRITAKDIAHTLSISLRQGERIMANLKEKGLIRHIGSNKSGHWEII